MNARDVPPADPAAVEAQGRETGSVARIAALRAARAHDSNTKRERTLTALRELHTSGLRVTFAGVARESRVSTWFTYNQREVRTAIESAMTDQIENGVTEAATPNRERVSSTSLQTELALARHELTETRRDRDRLRAKVQLALGAELDEASQQQLVNRINELERLNDEHLRASRESQLTTDTIRAHLRTTEDELAAARVSLRRVIRSENLR